jgi:hypothetical protein
MRQVLLPAAQELFAVERDRLVAAQRDAAGFPWAVLLLGLATLAALVGAQALLTRRTNRLVNPGLAVATLAGLVAFTWATVALAAAARDIDAGRDDGSSQVHLLAEARIAALQARADESLSLVARGGDGGAFEKDFSTVYQRLETLLGTAHERAPTDGDRAVIAEAQQHAKTWLAAHQRVRALDVEGRYGDAVQLATGTGADSPATLFGQLDGALTTGIDTTNGRFDDRADDAGAALTGADIVLIVLTLLLVAGAAAGMQRRIGEYR